MPDPSDLNRIMQNNLDKMIDAAAATPADPGKLIPAPEVGPNAYWADGHIIFKPMEGLTVGRMVHYVLPSGPSQGEHRPAVIVHVFDHVNGMVNLQVFIDGLNDDPYGTATDPVSGGPAGGVVWKTSVGFSEKKELGTWHWIERA